MATSKTAKKSKVQYDCSKCPGYCCSYPLIEIGKRDIARLAKHFEITYAQAESSYTRFDRTEKVRSLKQQDDKHFGKICKLFDTKKRQCTVYEARPAVCREYPEAKRCGYYEFLEFEREQQGDEKFIATTSNN